MSCAVKICIKGVVCATAFVTMLGVVWLWLLHDEPDRAQGYSRDEILIALKVHPASEYEDFMAKGIAYEYCGLDAKKRGFLVRSLGSRKKTERIVDALFFNDLVCFQAELERMEMASINNDCISFTNAINRMRKLLATQRIECVDPKVRFPSRLFFQCLEKTEYALLRCLEQKGDGIRPSAHDIISALPDDFFVNSLDKCKWMTGTASRLSALKVFRDMTIVASLIVKHDLEYGCLPQELDKFVDKKYKKDVKRFLYSHRGESWQLFYPKSSLASKLPFNVYVPSVFRDTGWPVPNGLWISSDFSEKRRTLYVEGCLNEDYPEWECRFVDGEIKRPK